MKKIVYFLCFLCACFSCFADTKNDFNDWKKEFKNQALKKGIFENTLNKYFSNIIYLQSVIDSDRRQPEFTLTFSAYMQKMATFSRAEKAKRLLSENRALFERIEKKYNVPANYLLAFWGLETNFGKNKGNIPILSALATLAFDERRSVFFTEQLIAMLQILQKEQIPEPLSSWAGAFGHFQFMPTTFQQYAKDGDNDNKIDVYNDFEDALESAANYLSKMGWQKGVRWGRHVIVSKPETFAENGKKHPISYWVEKGVQKADGTKFKPNEYAIEAELILPQGKEGACFLVYKNFYVIKKWNNSDFYAIAVGVLADKIAGYSTLNLNQLKKDKSFSRNQIKDLQYALTQLGFYDGKIDGMFGRKTKQSLKEYQKANKMTADAFLSEDLFNQIKKGVKQ
ncbi:MAG: lytic murein transglycosylase [Alphaproteobacteria bacterium]